MAKNFVIKFFFLILIATIVAVVAPSFINWNKHKDTLIAQISKYMDDDIKIDVAGNVSFRILPRPELVMEMVNVYRETPENQVLELEQLGAVAKLKPLLEGKIEFEYLELNRPTLRLTVNKLGQTNDINIFKRISAGITGGSIANNIFLNSVDVVGGKIIYQNDEQGKGLTIDDINLHILAGTVLGPYDITGDLDYKGVPLNAAIKLGVYKKDNPTTINIVLTPSDASFKFPEVKYSGIVDVNPELALQGELNIENGAIAMLFDTSGKYKNIAFMNDNAKLKTVISSTKNKIALRDTDATIGKASTVKGDIIFDMIQGKGGFVTADIQTKNLTISNRPLASYIAAPSAIKGKIKSKNSNLVLAGKSIAYAEADMDFTSGYWQINSAQLSLRGDSKLDLIGKVDIADNSAIYKAKISIKDYKKFSETLPIADNSLFKTLSDSGLLNGIALETGMSVKPDQVIFTDINAKLHGSVIKGVMGIDHESNAIAAKLSVTGLNLDKIKSGDAEKLIQAMEKSSSTVNIAASDLQNNGIKVKELNLKLASDNGILSIEHMNGSVSDNNIFAVTGKLNSKVAPYTDLSYSMQTSSPENVANFFGVKIPMLQALKTSSSIEGTLTSDAKGWLFELGGKLDGGKINIKGSSLDKGGNYEAAIDIKAKNSTAGGLSLIGLPIGELFGEQGDGAFSLSGNISGNDQIYKVEAMNVKIGSNVFSGTLAKDEKNHFTSDVSTASLDIDSLLRTPIAQAGQNSIIRLSGKSSWGGELKSSIDFSNKDLVNIKGSITNPDMNLLLSKLSLPNNPLHFADATLDFDINKSQKGVTGSVSVKSSSLEVSQLNYEGLGDMINGYAQVPPILDDDIKTELANGKTIYQNPVIKMKVDGNSLVLTENFKHNSNAGSLVLSKGSFNLADKSYSLSADINLSKPKKISEFSLNFVKGKGMAISGLDGIEEFIAKNNPEPVDVIDDVPTLPQAMEASAPKEDDAIEEAPIDAQPIAPITDTEEAPVVETLEPAEQQQQVTPVPQTHEKATPASSIDGILERLDN